MRTGQEDRTGQDTIKKSRKILRRQCPQIFFPSRTTEF